MKTYKKRAYDFYNNYANKTQSELKYDLTSALAYLYDGVNVGDGYVYVQGSIPVMLVAHMDTVHKELPKNVYFSIDFNRIKADEGIGGDDRCGAYIIMDILKNTSLRPYVLFVEDEEIGNVGSGKFTTQWTKEDIDIDYIIEIDRKGSLDSVYYKGDNKEFETYINKFGFTTAIGSFTDICKLCPHLQVAGVNLSSGYYNQHTNNEYVVISEMLSTKNKIIQMLYQYTKDTNYRHKFEWIEKVYTYVPTSYTYYNSNYDYKNYTYNYKYDNDNYNSYKSSDYCEYCGRLKSHLLVDEYGYNVCKNCIKEYNLKPCKECGYLTDDVDGLCTYCKKHNCSYDNTHETENNTDKKEG